LVMDNSPSEHTVGRLKLKAFNLCCERKDLSTLNEVHGSSWNFRKKTVFNIALLLVS